jgi:hypothetical protein
MKTQRQEWQFNYSGSLVANGAKKKYETHSGKLRWWEKKKKEVMKKVAESGIEIQDSVAASYSNTKGMFGPQIKIDAGLQRDLTEVQEKILEHHGLSREYAGWVQVLEANSGAQLPLSYDDWLYFFGE